MGEKHEDTGLGANIIDINSRRNTVEQQASQHGYAGKFVDRIMSVIKSETQDPPNVIGRKKMHRRRWEVAREERNQAGIRESLPGNVVPIRRTKT